MSVRSAGFRIEAGETDGRCAVLGSGATTSRAQPGRVQPPVRWRGTICSHARNGGPGAGLPGRRGCRRVTAHRWLPPSRTDFWMRPPRKSNGHQAVRGARLEGSGAAPACRRRPHCARRPGTTTRIPPTTQFDDRPRRAASPLPAISPASLLAYGMSRQPSPSYAHFDSANSKKPHARRRYGPHTDSRPPF